RRAILSMTIQDAVGHIRRVYVRPPQPEAMTEWQRSEWRSAPDPGRAIEEHAAFRETLGALGADILVGQTAVPGDLDAIYAYDPTLPTDRGVIVLRPGKVQRRGEPAALERDLVAAGLPVLGTLTAPATAEGGDMFWLDDTTLLIGRGHRTNDGGIDQIRSLLAPDVTVTSFDLPYFRGPGACLHLMSFISPLARDLVVAYPPMMPVRLMEILEERGIGLVEVPDEEFDSQGANVLALAPRVALALEGNPETRRRMEDAGVDVRMYAGEEISRKGDGGPTCLSRPLDRA
ncbi:MAG: arginine deiminase family protein, partial [Actinomycetota bacterium]|nr:arginine deiminase family protein [Actinomycetota bacterium]